MKQFLLAHDLGTSGNKATLFTEEGKLLGSFTVPYDTHYFNTNWSEQDPDDWWKAVCASTRALVQGIDTRELAVICFSGQMMGCLCVDREGRPLRPAILYSDQRAVRECAAILAQIDAREFYRITGHRASASYSVGKLTSDAAREMGLHPGIPVVAGGGDGVCAGVGVGSVKPGITYNYLGSSAWIATTTREPIFDEEMRTFNWAHAVPGYVHPCGTMQTAGSAFAWLKNEICTLEKATAAESSTSPYEPINAQIATSPRGANG